MQNPKFKKLNKKMIWLSFNLQKLEKSAKIKIAQCPSNR